LLDTSTPSIESLSNEELIRFRQEMRERQEQARRQNKIASLFPLTGPLRRELYVKHLEFFRGGREHQERCFMAANRVGKTVVGAYEATVHLTGEYPDWWEGHRFPGPVDAWAASDTGETTRDIVQMELIGPAGDRGTGMIPARCLGIISPRRGVTDAADQIEVAHVSGGRSVLGFKSFDQGRERFQGTKKDFIWLDEEPPATVYDECLVRLMTTNGLMMCTFTPLKGLSEIALRYLPHMAPPGEPKFETWGEKID
jgi:phage terminase large subunit-like protein